MDNLKKFTDKEYLKSLNSENIDIASAEIRQFLVDNVLSTGGHLASNLGIVELILALHKVFDFPKDKIVFDVGHQCYVHKILSGRYDKFNTLRQKNGLSGFPKTQESEYDSFNTGHSATSVSAALGMARARDLKDEKHNIIAFIGDGAIGGGMAFEALNDAGASESKIIVILNDNEMSINKNVGGLSSHLSMLRLNPNYLKAKSGMHKMLDKTGVLGKGLTRFVQKIKRAIKNATIRVPMFEELGLTYIGLIDGYDFDDIEDALQKAKKAKGSVVIHVATKKGKGFDDAEDDPSTYHGVAPKSASSSLQGTSFTKVFGEYMVNKGLQNKNLVSVTAAMCSGCGLTEFSKKYPDRFFDVGIAEEHAVTMCGGLAKGGLTPVFSVYSTFLQRGYDQILHDICLQNLHVVFALDRAGIVGEDGETHQGIFDFSYLIHMPNMTILAPSCKEEMISCLDYAIDKASGPVAIRFPKDIAISEDEYDFQFNKPRTVSRTGSDVVIISVGRMLKIASEATGELTLSGIGNHHINLCCVKPLDEKYLNAVSCNAKVIITIEDNIISGGAGQYIMSRLSSKNKGKIKCIGFDDTFVEQGTQTELFEIYNITPQRIVQLAKEGIKDYEQQT
ncbi:MAG: 1-deoxy-D-xylulose-5-phosphate synthase [Clostridia bacterium]|nr:1-deoxy-D-xylulose-5-phosphate synthase [Clostridia bacterium]